MMLRHVGEAAAADAIYGALVRVLRKGDVLTRDLGGRASTWEFTDEVIRELEVGPKAADSGL
jgi:isocitrate/isopropylmalate dehydrogenase